MSSSSSPASLFHSAEPLHTHPHCKNCYRMRRCEGSDADWKLQRCAGCNIATYCSRECQKANWANGHKEACKLYKTMRDRAIQLSGNPNAWSDLARWIEYHHTTLVNAALACILLKKDAIPDVAASHLLHISLAYRNNPRLPSERQFDVRGVHFAPTSDPAAAPMYALATQQRPLAVEMGRKEMGGDYWGTGTYLLMVQFRPARMASAMDGMLPFWKSFGIDKMRARATLAAGSPIPLLEDNLNEGKRLKFCCGKIEGMPTCCCGGWTHEVSGHQPKTGWSSQSLPVKREETSQSLPVKREETSQSFPVKREDTSMYD